MPDSASGGSRGRPSRRVAQPQVPSTPKTAARASRSTRGRVKVESDDEQDVADDQDKGVEDAEGEEEEEEEVEVTSSPAAGPSRRRANGGRRKSSAAPTRTPARSRQKATVRAVEPDAEGEDDTEGEIIVAEEDEDVLTEEEAKPKRTRTRKSVSYKEVPVEEQEDEPEDEEEDEDAEGEEDEGDDAGSTAAAATTPARRTRPAAEKTATPVKQLEKIGSGRGGFSVKGAAAAAARARWAKVRAEKAERGEDSDDGDRRRSKANKRESKAAVENVAIDTIMNIKGTDYTVGDDELVLPDDPKGELKIDANGKLLGGREYRLVTFTSSARRNPERIYALTIDAARACGYSDSLAFLRRCPQVLKLACNAEERQMLIDIGRITGNLKHRMVTMVTMRNVFKLMGARVVKNGKWVTDDYYEDESLAKCPEQGFTPYAPALEEDIIANALSLMQPQGRPPTNPNAAHHDSSMAVAGVGGARSAMNLTPFYTLGGPTTQFAGNGADPWSEAGWGNKRAKLRTWGVTEEDWMLRTAEECRRIDGMLRDLREDRLEVLEGKDAEAWGHYRWNATEEAKEPESTGPIEGPNGDLGDGALRPPLPDRKRSGLSQEVVPKEEEDADGDVEMSAEPDTIAIEQKDNEDAAEKREMPEGATPGGSIVIQKPDEDAAMRRKWNCGFGSLKPGVVKAVYEPHTHLPHVPLFTQPTTSFTVKASAYPIVASQSDEKHRNFVQSTISGRAATGLASVEYVFEPRAAPSGIPGRAQQPAEDEALHLPIWNGWGPVLPPISAASPEERKRRLQEVQDAEEWERRARRRKQQSHVTWARNPLIDA